MGTETVDFAGENSDDFDHIQAELFHRFFHFGFVEDSDFDSEVLAEKEDDLATEAEQSIFASEDQFLDLAADDEPEQLDETRFLVVHA